MPFIFFFCTAMLYHEKAEVIKECIDELKKWNWLKNASIHSWLLLAMETLEDLYKETIALAEQEGDEMEVALVKEGKWLDSEVEKGNIRNVGVDESYEEHEKIAYRMSP